MARTNRPDEAYHVPTLNVWFAISAIALMVVSGWMIWADYDREWKNIQRDFRELERAKLQHNLETSREGDLLSRLGISVGDIRDPYSGEMATADDVLEQLKAKRNAAGDLGAEDKEVVGKLIAAYEAVAKAYEEHGPAFNEVSTLIADLKNGEHLVAKTAYNAEKAVLGDQRYAVQHALAHGEEESVVAAKERKLACTEYQFSGSGEPPAGCGAMAERALPVRGEGIKYTVESTPASLTKAFKDWEDLLADLEVERAKRKEPIAQAEGARDEVIKEVLAVAKRQDQYKQGFFYDAFRDAPVVDFMAPQIKIRQTVITDIRDDYNFATVQKEDRCTTCHMSIDNAEYSLTEAGRFVDDSVRNAMEGELWNYLRTYLSVDEDLVDELNEEFIAKPEVSLADWFEDTVEDEIMLSDGKGGKVPLGYEDFTGRFIKEDVKEELRVRTSVFSAHPNLDLMVTPSSKHPMGQMGCTVCHEGRGHSTSFTRAYHTPNSKEMEAKWNEKYGWDRPHYWDKPQLPSEKASATCAKCHAEPHVQGGDAYSRGYAKVVELGCYGCHRMEGLTENLRKAGPSLRKVASKVQSPEFMYSWIWNPKHFRPSTKMPRFFEQSNNSYEPWLKRNQQEVRGMVAYLYKNTEDYSSSHTYPGGGNPAAGKKVFEQVGCLACHSFEQEGYTVASHGPDLSGTGTKLSAEFIYGWLKNPREYFPKTHMPSLRLSDKEAADVTAYLVSSKKDGWSPIPMPPRDEALQKDIIREALSSTWRRSELEDMLASKSADEIEVMLGDRAMKKHGCGGCHNIAGFEEVGPIGAELTTWADKFLTQLDFGGISYHGEHAEVDHTHIDWARNKLRNPRVWDKGKETTKAFPELLKMPKFNLTESEVEDVVTFLMSRTRQQVDVNKKPGGDAYANKVHGMQKATQYNCYGCHYFDGKGGEFAQYWRMEGVAAEFMPASGRPDFNYMEDVRASVRGHVPPVLLTQGRKTQPEWLFSFLNNPVMLRPKLKMRMPSFQFTDEEANSIVKMFAGIEGELIGGFDTYEPDPELVAIGAKLFANGRCTQCHLFADETPANRASIPATVVAPNLKMAGVRLQHDWIVEWLKNPQAIMPGANMPNYFDLENSFTTLDPDGSLLNGDMEKGLKAITAYMIAGRRTYKNEYAGR